MPANFREEEENGSWSLEDTSFGHRFQWNFVSLKGLPQNSKRQSSFRFGFIRGEIDHPLPGFFQLLWGFAHLLLHY